VTSGYGPLAADLVGVAVFAASGASAAIAKRLDLFGVAFAGFVAALGGAILVTVMRGIGRPGPFPPAIAALLRAGLRLLAPDRRRPAPVAVP
jgi:Glycine transporter